MASRLPFTPSMVSFCFRGHIHPQHRYSLEMCRRSWNYVERYIPYRGFGVRRIYTDFARDARFLHQNVLPINICSHQSQNEFYNASQLSHQHSLSASSKFRILNFLSQGSCNKRFISQFNGRNIPIRKKTKESKKKKAERDGKESQKHSLTELFRDMQHTKSSVDPNHINEKIKVTEAKVTKQSTDKGKLAENESVDGKKEKNLSKTQNQEKNFKNSKIHDKEDPQMDALSNLLQVKSPKSSRAKKTRKSIMDIKGKAGEKSSYVENTEKRRKELMYLFPPSGKSVMVVESATKAKTIQNYLGDMFVVVSSNGHIRDLAGRSGSVRPDDDFSMVWEVPNSAWTHLKSIKTVLNGAENLILATDPDREGEAIAWHIVEMLHQQKALAKHVNVARVVFHEITESSIKKSLQSPRVLDINLINAYLAKRALDYLIGFNISPLLWRKLPGCQSVGRVQSAALTLICDREMEIDKFKPQEYWTVDVEFNTKDKIKSIRSDLTHFGSKKLNFFSISSSTEAEAIKKKISLTNFVVQRSKKCQRERNPPMPYITSSLQQDSANRLHFSAAYTMKLAQMLYEGVILSDEEATGLITYARTDGPHISNTAAKDIHSFISQRFGRNYASKEIRKFFKKVKNPQEAHEAIRPTSISRLPSSLVDILDKDSLRLYTLIWTRTLACQMQAAVTDNVLVDIESIEKDIILRSSCSKINFLGYLAVDKDPEARIANLQDNEEVSTTGEFFDVLNLLNVHDELYFKNINCAHHHTKPPLRYSEGSLVKKLEELGIGRPSTYASIFKVLQDRKYLTTKNQVLYPEFRGRLASAFLSLHFSEVSDNYFTVYMENELDNVSFGKTEWKGLLKDYWTKFKKYSDLANGISQRELEKKLEKKFGHILFNESGDNSRACPSCLKGTMVFKISKYGSGYFIGCNQHPKCKYISQSIMLSDEEEDDDFKPINCFQPKLLGQSPGTQENIFLKKGPYGYYIQLGDDRKECQPKRVPVEDKVIESLTLEDAMDLLRYPVVLGNHPEDAAPVVLACSKHGFLIKHRGTSASLPKKRNPKSITLEDAVRLLTGKNVKITGRRVSKPEYKGIVLSP